MPLKLKIRKIRQSSGWTLSSLPLMEPRQNDSFDTNNFIQLQKLLLENKEMNGISRGLDFVEKMIAFVLSLKPAKRENAPNQCFRYLNKDGKLEEIYLSSQSWAKLQDWISAEVKKSSILENRNTKMGTEYSNKLLQTLNKYFPRIIAPFKELALTNQQQECIKTAIIKTISDFQHTQLMKKTKVSEFNFCRTIGEVISITVYNLLSNSTKTAIRQHLKQHKLRDILESDKFPNLTTFLKSKELCKLMICINYMEMIDLIIAKPKLAFDKEMRSIFSYSAQLDDPLKVIEQMLAEKKNPLIEYFMKKQQVGLGTSVLGCLYLDELITQNPVEKEKKNKTTQKSIEFNTDELIIDIPTELPLIFPRAKQKNTKIKISNKEISLRKKSSLVHNNLNTTGYLDEKQEKLLNKRHCLYKTNNRFFTEFLELLRYSINDLKDLSSTNISEKQPALTIISHLYKVDFTGFLNDNKPTQTFILDLIRYAADFENLKKPKLNFDPEFSTIQNLLQNKIRMTKISLNEIINSATIMSHFNFFSFSLFLDPRFRTYMTASALNPYLPMARNFLSFYMPDSLKDLKKRNKSKLRLVPKITDLLIKQIQDICPTYTYGVHLLDHKIKMGELFAVINLARDLEGFKRKPLTFRFLSFYSLDSRSSGLQNIGQILRSLKVAQFASIAKVEGITELYDMATQSVKQKLIDCIELVQSVQSTSFWENLVNFNKFKSKDIESYSRDIDHLAHSDWGCAREDKENVIKVIVESLGSLKSAYIQKCLNWLRITYNLTNVSFHLATMLLVKVTEVVTSLMTFSNIFDILFSRPLFKHPIMTLLYSSTYSGRKKQFLKSFLKLMNSNGKLVSNAMLQQFTNLIYFLDKFTVKYVIENVPESMLLLKVFQKVKIENSLHVKSPHFSFVFKPAESKPMEFQIKKRKYKLQVNTEILDRGKISTSFVPNLMQHADAILAALFFDLMHGLYPHAHGFTIHDRFFVNPIYCIFLKPVLKQAYLGFYNLNFLDCLRDCPGVLAAIEKEKEKYNITPLEPKDYTNENFVTH